MEFKIVASSPLATEAAKNTRTAGATPLYPFAALEVGQSFTGPLEGCNWPSLRVCTKKRSTDGKRFVLLKHEDLGIFEVSRAE